MATVHVTLSRVPPNAMYGPVMPVPYGVPVGADTLTSSASSSLASLTGEVGQFWSVVVTGGAVYVNFGPGSPAAGQDAGWLLLDAASRDFAVSATGEKCAIKDGP